MSIIRRYRTLIIFCVLLVIMLTSVLQLSLAITLLPELSENQAQEVFRKSGLHVDTSDYPVGFWASVNFDNIEKIDSSSYYNIIKPASDRLEKLDRQIYGDKFITLWSDYRGVSDFTIRCNGRATKDKLVLLIEQIDQLDSTSLHIEYPPKIFHIHLPVITGLYNIFLLHQDPRVNNTDVSITSIPLFSLFSHWSRIYNMVSPHPSAIPELY